MAASVRITQDIVYKRAGGVELGLDYAVDESAPPAGHSGERPIVMMIHGGAWLGGGRAKEGPRLVMRFFAEHGFLAASVSYRLSSQAIFPAQIHDVWDAIRWLRQNAESMGADARRLFATGHSAGGHLAALLGLTAMNRELGGDGIALDAVIPIAAPTHLSTMPKATHPDSPEALLIGGTPEKHQDSFEVASPLWHATRTDASPTTRFLLVHGRRDATVPFDQAERLHQALPHSALFAIGDGDHGPDSGDVGWAEILPLGDAFFRSSLDEKRTRS